MSQIYVPLTSSSPSVPTSFDTDNGTATPAANVLNIFGGNGIETSGSGNTVTINLNGVVANYVNVVGPDTYVVEDEDYYISCDTTAGPVTIVLPNVTLLYRTFIVKDRTGTANANNITLTTVGGILLIDGNANIVLTDDYEDVQILYNGTSYEIF